MGTCWMHKPVRDWFSPLLFLEVLLNVAASPCATAGALVCTLMQCPGWFPTLALGREQHISPDA